MKAERPVELRFGCIHPDLGVLPLRNLSGGVLGEVNDYYRETRLDRSGMKLKGGRFQKPKQRKRSRYGGPRGRRKKRR